MLTFDTRPKDRRGTIHCQRLKQLFWFRKGIQSHFPAPKSTSKGYEGRQAHHKGRSSFPDDSIDGWSLKHSLTSSGHDARLIGHVNGTFHHVLDVWPQRRSLVLSKKYQMTKMNVKVVKAACRPIVPQNRTNTLQRHARRNARLTIAALSKPWSKHPEPESLAAAKGRRTLGGWAQACMTWHNHQPDLAPTWGGCAQDTVIASRASSSRSMAFGLRMFPGSRELPG